MIEAPIAKEKNWITFLFFFKQTDRHTWRIVDCHMLRVTATDPPPANSSKLPNFKQKKNKKLDRAGIVDNRPSTDSLKHFVQKKRRKKITQDR